MILKTVFLVIPCYNEQEVLPETTKRLTAKLYDLINKEKISHESRILYVDDGSRDGTWEMIENFHKQIPYICGLKLARNKGHQNALMAGMTYAYPLCDALISMDCDLQDDIDAIDGFIDKFNDGCDIVYGVRSSRKTDTFFKRFTAEGFYKLMKALGVDLVFNHADYRLMSRRAVEGLMQYGEVNMFLRGIVPQIGYKTAEVYYERAERFAGESKYPLKKMLAFAFDGITSFSVKPIKMILNLGITLSALSVLYFIVLLIMLICGANITLMNGIFGSIWLLGGIQLIAIGLVGEYIGKIYGEVKHRPRFIIEEFLKR